jgi:cyclohexanecarboxylate-CoA ligase
MTTWDLLVARAAQSGDCEAFVDERGLRLSFAGLRTWAEKVAGGLHALGVVDGAVVAWQLPTWIESFVLTTALARLGAIQVPLLPIYRSRELRYILATTGAGLYIAPTQWGGTDYRQLFAASVDDGGTIGQLFLAEDRRLPEGDPATLPPGPSGVEDSEHTRWIYHTSGTTAAPKGAKHNDRSVIASTQGWVDAARLNADDALSAVFPMTHIGGLNLLLAGLMTGCRCIVAERWEPATIDLLAREGCTLPGAGPMFFFAYLDEQRRRGPDRLFPLARAFPSGGAAKSPDLHYRLKREMGAGILANYGMTECPTAITSPVDAPDEKLAETEGRPSTGLEVKIVDEVGTRQPVGAAGQIALRGPQVFQGYVDERMDVDAFDEEGFLLSGDLGSVDADGFVRIVGRVKDVIIRKGENISAKEIEDLLFTHPDVQEVAVIGLPDAMTGERCCAVVVPSVTGAQVDTAVLARFLQAEGLMMQKIPERWELVDELPHDSAGKVLKAQLRGIFAQERR